MAGWKGRNRHRIEKHRADGNCLGLEKGDEVVISPIMDLKPGQTVRTHWIDPVVAAALNEPKTSDDSRIRSGFR